MRGPFERARFERLRSARDARVGPDERSEKKSEDDKSLVAQNEKVL